MKDNIIYRSVHLWVNTSLDRVKFAELPNLTNGDMEWNNSWMFSVSGQNITGNYSNNISQSRVYEINFTTEEAGQHGTIYQNLTTYGDVRAVISFDVRDSEYSNASYYVFKQALLDGQVIWERGAGGKNSSWEHIEVPVLFSGNNTLAFRVYSKYRTNYNVTVWWDNVLLKPYGVNKTEPKRAPIRKVYEFKFNLRGAPIMLEKSMRIDGFGFPGFHYNISENISYEELSLEISDDNQIGTGNATYITRLNGSEINIMCSRYRILSKDMPANLSKILETYPNTTLTLGKAWSFGGTYSLLVRLISSKGDSAMLELRKGGSTLDSRLIGKGGIYEYRANIGKFSVTIFKAKVDSIRGDDVHLTSIELYSDTITALNPGTFFGDFEVINITSKEIVFRNSYPFELKDKTVILNGSAGFSVEGDMLYPYASGTEMRGTPQYISAGRWMNITGFNYPGFYLYNNTSYEELKMYLSGDGFVRAGDAAYSTKRHYDTLSFLGETYEFTNRPGLVSTVKTNKEMILYANKTQNIGGYQISFKKLDNDSIMITIRKFITKERQKLLNKTIESNITFFPDTDYEIYTGKSGTLRKSNILSIGDAFEYWEEYREDRNYKALAGELKSINNNSIELQIREYDLPFIITAGKTYGEFEVESITNDIITLRNIKPLRFMPGKETSILNGALKIKTSSNEYLAYPAR
ncbi:putative membrane protein [groundwater metagenome]